MNDESIGYCHGCKCTVKIDDLRMSDDDDWLHCPACGCVDVEAVWVDKRCYEID